MELWDGYDKNRNERTRYDTTSDRFTYYIDEGGAIYYTDNETPTEPPRIWCPPSMLTAHLMRLYQIKNR
jgi:hypothetical protein